MEYFNVSVICLNLFVNLIMNTNDEKIVFPHDKFLKGIFYFVVFGFVFVFVFFGKYNLYALWGGTLLLCLTQLYKTLFARKKGYKKYVNKSVILMISSVIFIGIFSLLYLFYS